MCEFTDVFAIRHLMSPLKEGAVTNPLALHVGEKPDISDFDETANDHMEYFDSVYMTHLNIRRR